jgi:CheY-like chemotaxis protein
MIEKSGDRLLNIINDIISISQVESGQMEISISETNINEQIDYIYSTFHSETEKKGILLSYKKGLPNKEVFLKTDCNKVYAILTNLIKNAIKFTQTGSIIFGYEKKDKYLEFFVKDTGVGIRPDLLKIVFERFKQGSESLTRNYEGAGLGLSIAKAYVKMFGGKIWAESEERKGSTFYFTIPYNAEPLESNVIKNIVTFNETDNRLGNFKILIAEDDESSAMLQKEIVGNFSRDILLVMTGIEAIAACHSNPDIDLILMDLKMPVMDGYEATRQIRLFNKEVIIIAQTAYAFSSSKEKAIAAGCNEYISKPINKALMIELIKKNINKS